MIDMSPSLALVLVVVGLTSVGVYLLLERSLTRVLLGIIILSNAVNVMFLIAGGRAGGPPLVGRTPEDEMSDPLPQAMVLTAIVITLGITAFLLAMAYRSWQINRHDEVQDDVEDRRVARRAASDLPSYADADAEVTTTLDEDAAQVRDETAAERMPEPEGTSAPGSRPVPSAEGGDTR